MAIAEKLASLLDPAPPGGSAVLFQASELRRINKVNQELVDVARDLKRLAEETADPEIYSALMKEVDRLTRSASELANATISGLDATRS